MVKLVFNNAFEILKKKPIKLWGLSLLAALLTLLASIFGVLPIISVPIALTISAGMLLVYLDGYNGKEVDSKQIFAGFQSFKRIAGGMLWMNLWILIWALIPVVGIVFAVIKAYSYRFTPYILFTQPEVSVFDALKLSMKQTEGYKGRMFGADMIIIGSIIGAFIILALLGAIPYIGVLFKVIYFIVYIVTVIFVPLLSGLVQAGMYQEITDEQKA